MQDQPRVDEGRAEPCLTDPGAAVDQAEHHGSHSSSSSTLNTRQSHTTKWAVARYVSHPVPISNIEQFLTLNNVGQTTATNCQAEQPPTPCHSLALQIRHPDPAKHGQSCQSLALQGNHHPTATKSDEESAPITPLKKLGDPAKHDQSGQSLAHPSNHHPKHEKRITTPHPPKKKKSEAPRTSRNKNPKVVKMPTPNKKSNPKAEKSYPHQL